MPRAEWEKLPCLINVSSFPQEEKEKYSHYFSSGEASDLERAMEDIPSPTLFSPPPFITTTHRGTHVYTKGEGRAEKKEQLPEKLDTVL